MEPFEVKFGTPTPIPFREYDKNLSNIDIDLAVFIAGRAVVLDYDPKLYEDEESVKVKIRGNALLLLQNCLMKWPEGKSVMGINTLEIIAETLDREFSAMGIRTKSEITGFQLTQESEEMYKTLRRQAALKTSPSPALYDYMVKNNLITGNEGQPKQERWMFLDKGMEPDCIPPLGFDPAKANDIPGGLGIVREKEEREIRNMPTDHYCRLCGEKRPEGAPFCPGCGAKFGNLDK